MAKLDAKDANPTNPTYNRIGSAAVKAKTGRTWAEWLAFLDRAGARKMSHAQIAAHLHESHGLSGWWRQMVAVGYEQARGLRARHQRPGGFEISVSRTVAAPATALFDAWKDARVRRRWLPGTAIVIRKATRPKSMRITWSDRKTSLEVGFYAKGMGKGQVVVQHSKLPDAKAAAKMKRYWANTLDRLRETLED
jgi:uncharacterized protein YndB with AHSA1/START domain